jgi:hypothetical protein
MNKENNRFKTEEIDMVKQIEVIDMEINNPPRFCDSFIISANWIDSGKELNDEELDFLNDDGGFVYETCEKRFY